MEKIIEKIKNLLDLANNNPNEHEAIAATLKAQELMAKYNIEIAQLENNPKQREIGEEIYFTSNKHEVKKWRMQLALIISKNFRCKVYNWNGNIVFYGYKEDAKIALQVFSFLYETGNKFTVRYYNKCKKEGIQTKGVMNTYLAGFMEGIASVLEKQCTALMIVTPKEVEESFTKMSAKFVRKSYSTRTNGNAEAFQHGKRDGKDIATARSIEG